MRTTGAWAGGLGLGMIVAGAWLIRASVGEPLTWAPLFWGAICLGAVPFADFFLPRLWAIIVTVKETKAQWRAQQAPAPALEPVERPHYTADRENDRAWLYGADTFLLTGDTAGNFGIRWLANSEGKHPETYVISPEDWSIMVRCLVRSGILVTSARGTFWAPGWDRETWKREWLQTPLLHEGQDAPRVWTANSKQPNARNTAQNTV